MATLDIRRSAGSLETEHLAQNLFGSVLRVESEHLPARWEALPPRERMIWLGIAVERARWLSA